MFTTANTESTSVIGLSLLLVPIITTLHILSFWSVSPTNWRLLLWSWQWHLV